MQDLTDQPSKTELPYDPEDWKRGYLSQPNEYDYAIADIDGEIPPDLNGTLFRNGPGLLEIGGLPLHHPFDGDGMISAIAFRDGRAHYRIGLCSAGQCIQFQPDQPTRAIVIPRDPNRRRDKKVLEIESGFVFHHVNAFERDDEIWLDSICYERRTRV